MISEGNLIDFTYNNKRRRGSVIRVYTAQKNRKEIIDCKVGRREYRSFRLEDMHDIRHVGILRQWLGL